MDKNIDKNSEEKLKSKNKIVENIKDTIYIVEFQNSKGQILKNGGFYLNELMVNGEFVKAIKRGEILDEGIIKLDNLPNHFEIGYIGESGFEEWFEKNFKLEFGKNIIRIEKSGIIEVSIKTNTKLRLSDYVVPYYKEDGTLIGGIGLLIKNSCSFEINGLKKGNYYFEIKKNYDTKDCLYKSKIIKVIPGKKSKTNILFLNN